MSYSDHDPMSFDGGDEVPDSDRYQYEEDATFYYPGEDEEPTIGCRALCKELSLLAIALTLIKPNQRNKKLSATKPKRVPPRGPRPMADNHEGPVKMPARPASRHRFGMTRCWRKPEKSSVLFWPGQEGKTHLQSTTPPDFLHISICMPSTVGGSSNNCRKKTHLR